MYSEDYRIYGNIAVMLTPNKRKFHEFFIVENLTSIDQKFDPKIARRSCFPLKIYILIWSAPANYPEDLSTELLLLAWRKMAHLDMESYSYS